MVKQRIVLETTEERKAALAEKLDLQGESFTDWMEDQIEAAIAPSFDDGMKGITQPASMADLLKKDVMSELLGIDWAFTSANTRYLTHDLHPYPAKFPPQIPAHLIAALSMPGDVIMDPFGGSGTTAVEAVRLRRTAISIDANPLSTLVGKTKVAFLDIKAEEELDSLETILNGHILEAGSDVEGWAERLLDLYSQHVPDIPNFDKWFCASAAAELALIKHLIISATTSLVAQDAAWVAFSRIITRVSNQDSETRYVASKDDVPIGFTLKAFKQSLQAVKAKLITSRSATRGASADFLQADSRHSVNELVQPDSVDLIVTSPPYPNATDYHLYHRFRLFWLGFDPRKFGAIEIGSHLKHQRKNSDFVEYEEEMSQVLAGCFTVLQPGRFAVFVVGDAVFKGELFSTSRALESCAAKCGFEIVGIIDRPIHDTKRSFAQPARRARTEQLLILRKPNSPISIEVEAPAYRMWPYEKILRAKELEGLGFNELNAETGDKSYQLVASQPALWNCRRAAFSTFSAARSAKNKQPLWQKILENGDSDSAKRKDPKYATHGLHAYKGKFYPQLAKSLLNLSGVESGSRVLDPYCGSGTVALECLLNGHQAFGFDLNPMAAKIARAKTGILLVDPDLVEGAMSSLAASIPEGSPEMCLDQFDEAGHSELLNWFPEVVLAKLNLLLKRIRLMGNHTLVDFFEVIVSSIIRDISQQEPTDLRIRRRKELIKDAPVYEMFFRKLTAQNVRLRKYWSVAARQPGPRFAPLIIEGDSRREECFATAGISDESIDCVVTSPPYATALPYIDTDRLSLLAILGMQSSKRAVIESKLTGSREIRTKQRTSYENELAREGLPLPRPVIDSISFILESHSSEDVGFRRKNMPALLLRYFLDIRETLLQVRRVMRPGAMAFYVVGDSRTKVGNEWFAIQTCKHVEEIAKSIGLEILPKIEISVTTERMIHMKNAITENDILIFRRS